MRRESGLGREGGLSPLTVLSRRLEEVRECLEWRDGERGEREGLIMDHGEERLGNWRNWAGAQFAMYFGP